MNLSDLTRLLAMTYVPLTEGVPVYYLHNDGRSAARSYCPDEAAAMATVARLNEMEPAGFPQGRFVYEGG